MRLLEYIESKASDGRIVDAGGRDVEVLVNPSEVRRAVTGEESVIIVRTRAEAASSVFEIADGGHLRLTEVFLAGTSSKCVVRQGANSRCDATCIVVAAASATYEIDLDGRDAENSLRGAFIVGGEEGAAPDDLEGDEFEYLPENRVIDMTPLIEQALLLELPLVPLCADDCKGICPRCGANLNEGPCSCAEAAPAEDGPFAALRNLKLED